MVVSKKHKIGTSIQVERNGSRNDGLIFLLV